MSKAEATRLADALRQSFPAFGDGTRSDRERLALEAAAKLRQWPDGEPVAWLVEGWHDGKLIARIPHLTVDEAKASAAVFSQHYTTTKTVPLYTAARIAELEAQRDALRRLIADDAHAMTFQTLGQYRSALLAAIKESQR